MGRPGVRLLFESLYLRDIAAYLEASIDLPSPSVYYYRDSYGLEVDCIVELAEAGGRASR